MEESSPEHPALAWVRRNTSWLALAAVVAAFLLPRLSPFEGLNQYLNFAQRFSEWTLRKLESLFKDYGYWVVFFGVLLENSMFLGLLVPGAIILILAGLAAQNGAINIWYVLALGITATIIGDTLSYGVGRLGWARVLERGSLAPMMERVRTSMDSSRTWIILAYHFAGYSRVVGPAAAGLFRIPYRKWAPLDYAGGSLWVFVYTMLGVVLGLFGVEFGDTKRMVNLFEIFFTVLLVAAVAGALYRSRRSGPNTSAAATPATLAPEED
ncbi:MAG: DedA family protein [Chloroflexota bacterium]|nr:DedA family protein [Chloroflexota bacterium]